MLLFYCLTAIMALDQHPIWGRDLGGTFTVVKAVGLLCLLVALYKIGSTGVYPPLLRSPQARWFAAFFLLQCSSYLLQSGQLVSAASVYSNVFSVGSLFIVAVTLVDSRPRLRRTLLVALGAVAFSSLHAIRQQQLYGSFGYRPSGLSSDSNEYALVAGMWIPLAFIWAFSERPRWERAFCFGCFLTALLGVTFAASRGGFIGLVAGFLFLAARSRKRVRNLVLISLFVAPASVILPSAVHRFTEPGYAELIGKDARLVAWKAGLRMIRTHPLVGVGLGNFRPTMVQYTDPGVEMVSLAHNTYVEIAAELGIPALIVFLGIFVGAFRALERVRRRAQAAGSTSLFNIALGLEAGLVAYLSSACFLSAWWYKLVWLLVFLTVCTYHLSSKLVVAKNPSIAPIRPIGGYSNTTSLHGPLTAARYG